jgi:histidinol phosphatase-like enzyme (inositol monophosphatase family)
MKDIVQAAVEVAKIAGEVALTHYQRHLEVARITPELKRDGSPVSAADRAAEEAARVYLRERFAADGIVGEELGEERGSSARRWCIDPIDGTKSFLAGAPLWGTLIALVEGQRVLAGAAYFPVTRELVAAGSGEALWVEGALAGVSNVAELSESTVLTTDARFPDAPECVAPFNNLSARARVARTWGDCYGYYLVATGRAELMTDGRLSIWDAACFLPIIEAAGGVFTDWAGERTFAGKGVIATNRALAKPLRAALGVPFTALETP